MSKRKNKARETFEYKFGFYEGCLKSFRDWQESNKLIKPHFIEYEAVRKGDSNGPTT